MKIKWTEKEINDLKKGILPKNRSIASIRGMRKKLGLTSSVSRRKWDKKTIDLLKKFIKEGKKAKEIAKEGLIPYNQNSIQKQMGRLGLSKKIQINKLPKKYLIKLTSFLKDNWNKYIPEVLVEKWNEENELKINKKIVVYHLKKLNLKVPYNEVYKIKYRNKTTFEKEDNLDLKVRREKIKSLLPIKYFYEKEFDSSDRNKILKDLKIQGLNEKHIFKCGPLLKKDQEYHLFRKYNYLKHRLFKLTSLSVDRLKTKSILEIENNIRKIENIRNTLIKCNTRLIVKPASRHFDPKTFNGDEFISNGYFALIKAIDCFDHRKGFKFSTYCIWVIRNNLIRDREKIIQTEKKVCFYSEHNEEGIKFDPVDHRSSDDHSQINYDYNKSFVKTILEDFEKKCGKRNAKQRIEILKKLYGLNDQDPAILREVGNSLGVSKERIRQIKNDTIKSLQELNYIYDPVV